MLAAVGILLLMASTRPGQCACGDMFRWLMAGDDTITGDQADFFLHRKDRRRLGSEEQKINLYGDSSEDMAGGLLKTGRLIAHPA